MNQTYIVKAGDTLYGISNQFGVSVADILSINNVNPNNLQIGQTINIPNVSGTNPSNTFAYTVKKGDTLYSIANKYKTTVAEIIKINNLNSTNLTIGQVINIPEEYPVGEMNMPNFINYTVKRGDTLYSIANAYNVNINTIMQDNNLMSNNLQIGQNLKIRMQDGNDLEVEECFGTDYIPTQSNTITYIVKRGDSLYKIANKYNTSVSAIMNLNNLKSINLSIGQQLKIPNSSGAANTTYIVKRGDSLYSIAQKFNTTVNSIKAKNNLSSNLLSIGQSLII